MKVKLLSNNARLPSKGSENAAAYDLYSPFEGTIEPGYLTKIDLDIAIEIPHGTYAQIASRSGLASKGIVVYGGVIDSDYRGNVSVLLANNSETIFKFNKGDRIAQLIVIVISNSPIEEVNELSSTNRGASGFGSTGK